MVEEEEVLLERGEDQLQLFARELGPVPDLVQVMPAVQESDDSAELGFPKALASGCARCGERGHDRQPYRSNLATTEASLSRHISLSHRRSSMDGRPGSTITLGDDVPSSGRSE